jgi:hypothetical protein
LAIYSSSCFSFENATKIAPIIKRIPIISSVILFSLKLKKEVGFGNSEEIIPNTLISRNFNLKSKNIIKIPRIVEGIKRIHPKSFN